MNQTLYLYYTESLQSLSLQSSVYWTLCDANQSEDIDAALWQESTFEQLPTLLPEAYSQFNCNLIIAIENMLSTEVTLPGKQPKYLKQALPFLIEEKLAIDVDSMHLATGVRLGNNRYPVIAINRDSFHQLLNLLKKCDISPSLAIADALLLQSPELYIGNTRSLLNVDSGQAIGMESENIELILNSAFQNCDNPETPELKVEYESELPGEIGLLLQSLASTGNLTIKAANQANALKPLLLQRLLDSKNSKPINLLQGGFAVKRKKSSNNINWKPFASAAAIILGLNLIYNIGSGLYFNIHADNITFKTEQLYRQYFPQDKRIQDIKRQTKIHLRNSGSSGASDFLDLLAAMGSSWKNPNNKSLQLQQLRYNAKRGQMTLEIQAKSINQLDTLQRDISSNGIKAELMSANESDNGVRGRLQLGG